MKEITLEITNYCPNYCEYCSSNADITGSTFLKLRQIKKIIKEDDIYDRINISGGEPLANPEFYKILKFCEQHSVSPPAIYSNAIKWLFYNANVIDSVRVEANLTITDDIKGVHLLKRVVQGREKTRPEIVFSHNWDDNKYNCSECKHKVVRPDGSISMGPCRKEIDIKRR